MARINYGKVIGQANDINSLSQDLGNEISRLEKLLADIKSNWCGPASQAFQKNLVILIADMKETKYAMSSVSTTIKNVANRIQLEDERLANQVITNFGPIGTGVAGGGGGGGSFGGH